MAILAEDLALLLIDPASGYPVAGRIVLDRAISGAWLLDLTLCERITVDGAGSAAQLVPADPSPTAEPLLDDALRRLGNMPIRARRAVQRLAKRAWRTQIEQLVARGVVIGEKGYMLGLIPNSCWRPSDPARRTALAAAVRAVLVDGAAPDQRSASLISLLHAVKAETKVVDGPGREMRAVAGQIADGDWAGEAVRRAVQDIQVMIMAAGSGG